MALGGVTVVLQGPQGEDATLTDDKGVYNFTSLPVGTVRDPVLRGERRGAGRAERRRDLRRQDGPRQRPDRGRRPGAGAGEVRHHRQAAGRRHRQRARRRELRRASSWRTSRSAAPTATSSSAPRARSSIPAATSRSAARPASRTSTSSTASTSPASSTATSRRERRPSAAAPTCRSSSSRRSTSAPAATRRRWAAAWAASSTASSSPAPTSSTAARSGSGRRTGSSANPNSITTVGGSLGYVRKPDFDTSIGVEVGGPIIKDKLFFWAGFAPRFQDTHVFRQTYQLQYDPTTMSAQLDANGNPISKEIPTGARASPSHARRTTTPRRSTGFPAPSTT